jgi:hypothetical protein
MNYAIEMASGGMMCVPNFMMISSGVQKLGGGDIRVRFCETRQSDKPTFIFSK